MEVLGLILVAAAITAVWPVNRWVMEVPGSSPRRFGLAMSALAALFALAAALVLKNDFSDPVAWLCGAAGGGAFAIGYCVFIFGALKIGPTGPTAMLNNLGLLWPLAAGMVWFGDAAKMSAVNWCGAAAMVVCIVLMGWAQPSGTSGSGKWLIMALLGWVGAGISALCQLLSGRLAAADTALVYSVSMFAMAAVLLLALRPGRPTRREWIGGAVSAAAFGWIILPLSVMLAGRMPSAVVFPVTQALPVILVLCLGRLVFHEKVSSLGYAACVLGVTGVVLLGV